MKKANIGAVCLARKTFDFESARQNYQKSIDDLKKLDDINWSFINELIIEPREAQIAGEILAANNLDGLVIISGTFHLGHLALILNKYIHCPVLFWGLNELPYNGGKIRLNSVCGVNLNASIFYKTGIDSYCCHVGESIDKNWLNAIRMKTSLYNAHVGLAGLVGKCLGLTLAPLEAKAPRHRDRVDEDRPVAVELAPQLHQFGLECGVLRFKAL